MYYNAALIGERIRKQRKLKGLIQEQLAKMLEISPSYLGQIENGHRGINVQNLVQVCNVLLVTPNDLMADYITNQLTGKKEPRTSVRGSLF